MPYAVAVDRDRYGFERNVERPIPIERVNDSNKKTSVLQPPLPPISLLPNTTKHANLVNDNNLLTTTNNSSTDNIFVIPSTASTLSTAASTTTTVSPKKMNPIPTVITVITPLNAKNKTEQKRFKDLDYDDIQINLRVITNLNEGEKIMIINDKHMQPENRYFSGFIMRGWSGDSVETTLQFIDHLIEETKKQCDEVVVLINSNSSNTDIKQYNLNKLIDTQTLLKSSINGLNKLATTYKCNQLNVATIDTQIATIRTFCDQDLKKVVAASYHQT